MLLFLLHLIFSSFICFLFATVYGQINPLISILSLSLGTVLAWYAGRENIFVVEEVERKTYIAWFVFLLLGFIGFYNFLYLYNDNGREITTLLKNNYGDLPLHLSFIKNIGLGASFPLDNPIFPGQSLRYPIGIDLYSAMLENLNIPTKSHLFLVGVGLFFASISVLFRVGGVLLVGGFFLNGGIAGLEFLKSFEFLDYQSNLAWKNFLLTLFIPQRSMMIALPLGLILIYNFRKYFFVDKITRNNSMSKINFFLLGVLWGLLAFYHLHAFLVVSLVIGFYLLSFILMGKNNFFSAHLYTPILIILVPAVLIASPLVIHATDNFTAGSMITIKWGWEATSNIFLFWFKETGMWMPFFIISILYLSSRNIKERKYWSFNRIVIFYFSVLFV